MCRIRSVLLASLLAAPLFPVHSQIRDADAAKQLDAFVARAVQDWKVAGLAVAVVHGGRVVFAKGYGVREMGKPEPVDTQTLFAIASTTKAMTAAALGM